MSDLHHTVSAWLSYEAQLLDTMEEPLWLDTLVHQDVRYQVPVRQTVNRKHGTGFIPKAFHLDETWGTLQARVARLRTDFAWGEDPPSRSRHFITNVRVSAGEGNTVAVSANLLLSRTRGDQSLPLLMAYERQDVLTPDPDHGFRLLRRTALLDLSVLQTSNLAVIF